MTGGKNMNCPECEFDNTEGTAYCDACGLKLSSDDMPSPSATTAEAEVPQPAEAVRLVLAETGSEYIISKDIVVLGRESVPDDIFPEIDLTLGDPEGYVSRRHAQMQRQDEHYIVIDLDSKNGTFVNNNRLSVGAPHPLANSDKVRLGKLLMTFLLPDTHEGGAEAENLV